MASAPLASAAIGAVVANLLNNGAGFSARHEQSYDIQTALTQRLVEGFTKAYGDGEIDDEDHETYITMRDR